ncbi:DUF4382 domain-containing protein [Marinobacter shengliensis]|uniref:DUF4382 domain-containing protein n=1 Tax=Marinobacter shengliensis TaxID=1389223 RepID=UPI001E4B8972|nr:DUF4382 domain-containing protein [Marinobacter shengliensis]MCD1629563.1 DUF4382 domain-containing protein [Marinobacter shengliensis]
MKRSTQVFAVSALAAALAACGGSGDGSLSSGQTGTVSMGLTDAPTMDLSSVNVAFNAIRLKPVDGQWQEFSLDEVGIIDLLTLQGGVTQPLITDEEVPAGEYEEIRLIVDTEQSWVTRESEGDARYTLGVPSGEQSGLKLKGNFIVAADTSQSFTIDFDVRKSIVDPQGRALGDYMLKPVLRLVNNLEVGKLTGEVDYATILQARNDNPGRLDCSPNYDGAVYVYAGEIDEPVDLNVEREGLNPLMVVPVTEQEDGDLYEWTAAFLTEGTYTISYSCQLDDNETDDDIEFEGTQTLDVIAGETTVADSIPLQI